MHTTIKMIGNQCIDPGEFYKYQSYYIQGFKELTQVDFNVSPFHSKLCASLIDYKIKGAVKLWRFLNSITGKKQVNHRQHVGRYIFDLGSNRIKVAIDVADGNPIRDRRTYNWSDIYFKANKWESLDYPEKVFPLVNGNGTLTKTKLDQIKFFRNSEKKNDLVFMTIIYNSTSEKLFYNNIEHHIRLFETLAKLDCKKYLKAIIPPKYPQKEMTKYLHRLDRAKVQWSNSWDGMSSLSFWNHLAEAQIVFLRPGKHACISWRMIDLLCMGACIVYDGSPHPNWPVPLIAGQNFVDCGCGLGIDESLPPIEQYDRIRQVIEKMLTDPQKMKFIRRNNRNYFDNHASPLNVATYILNTVKALNKGLQRSIALMPVGLTT
ncbi:MAG: hypothetical protein PVI90_04695 [Desulfobacteraceae bacterium]|jgi:hypothetical protein